jgi:spoIIIJ-associated protein
MDWIEVTARSVDDAKELALDRLGVVEEELEFEILDEPKGGLFGLGRADARIRARVKPLSRDKPTDRRRRGRGRSDRPSGAGSGGSGSKRAPRPETAAADSAARPKTSDGSRSRRRRGGRGGTSGGGSNNSPASKQPAGPVAEGQEEADVEAQPVMAQAEHAQQFTDELVRTMGFTATVRSDIEDEDIEVRIEGESLGVLVGPKGVTLRALEEVVRAATQHFAGGHSARVHVDVGGYQARRREALAEFTRGIAAEVAETGTARSLEPMHAPDRKVVHDVVSEIEGVITSSEGEEPRRRVVIKPE